MHGLPHHALIQAFSAYRPVGAKVFSRGTIASGSSASAFVSFETHGDAMAAAAALDGQVVPAVSGTSRLRVKGANVYKAQTARNYSKAAIQYVHVCKCLCLCTMCVCACACATSESNM